MRKKIISACLATVLVLSTLTGCGQNSTEGEKSVKDEMDGGETTESEEGEGESSADVQKEEENTAVDGRKIEGDLKLALFQGGYGAEYWEELIARFKERYPDVDITYEINPKIGEVIRPQIISGDVPDMIYHNTTQNDGVMRGLVKDYALMDISDIFEEQALDKDEKLKDIILPGMLESAAYAPYGDGKIYLAPFNTAPTGLIYNKTLFAEKNWEIPETWEEFFALGDTAKEDGRALMTFPGIYPGYCGCLVESGIASNAGIEALNSIFHYEEGAFENAKVKDVLENVQKIYEGGYLLKGSTGMNHTQSQSEMMLGHALFIPNGTWIENEMKDAPREGDGKFEFALLPCLKMNKSDQTYVSTSIEQLSIPKDAKNPEAAKEFIKFIYTDESVKLFGEKTGGTISVRGATDLIAEYLSVSQNNMLSVLDDESIKTFSSEYIALPQNAKFSSANLWSDGLVPVLNGDMDVEGWSELVEEGFAGIRELQEKE